MRVKIVIMSALATLLLATSASAATTFGHTNIYLDNGTYYGFHDLNDVNATACGTRGVCYTAYVPYAGPGSPYSIEFTQASIKTTDTINSYNWYQYVDNSPWWVNQTGTPAPFSLNGYTYLSSNYADQSGEIDSVNCQSQVYMKTSFLKGDGLWYNRYFMVYPGCFTPV